MGELASMYLRGYLPRDLEALYTLDRLCFEAPFRFSRGAMRQFAQAGNALVQLACARAGAGVEDHATEDLLGFSIVHLEGEGQGAVGYVVTLDVAPAARRQGIAEILMRSGEAAAAKAGAKEMALHVFSANAGAVRLYERLGYQKAGTAENFYGRGLHAVIYRKRLAQKPFQREGSERDQNEAPEEAAVTGSEGGREDPALRAGAHHSDG